MDKDNQSTPNTKFKNSFKLTPEIGALLALFILSSVLTFSSQYFFTFTNFINLIRQVSILGITGVGMTLVIINGGIDLSVGSVIALSGTLVAGFMQKNGMPPYAAVILTLIIGSVLGLINGALITTFNIPPIIATLSTMIVYKGLALVYTGGYSIPLIGKFMTPGRGFLGPIPMPTIIMIVVYIIAFIILKYTMIGRMAYGLGGNYEAVYLSGRSVRKYRLVIYMLSGITASLAGIVLASRLSAGSPMGGEGMELDAIAATVLGGTNINGGVGNIVGTIIGAFLLVVIGNGLNLMNISPYGQYIAKGAILAIAVAINSMKDFQKT